VKRTARDTGLPEATIRRWKQVWEAEGPPDTTEVQVAVSDFLTDAKRIRNKALMELERLIDAQQVKANDLNNVMGTLADKIDRANGLANSRVEHRITLPSPEELRAALAGLTDGARELAQSRQEEIIDAQFVEQPALPAGS